MTSSSRRAWGGQEEGGRGGGHCASHQKSPVAMATASEERRRGTAPARSLSLSPKGPLGDAGVLNLALLAPGEAVSVGSFSQSLPRLVRA